MKLYFCSKALPVKVLLVMIGKTDEKCLEACMEKYSKRLPHYIPFEMKVLPDPKNRRSLSVEQQKAAEADLIRAVMQAGDELVLLDENGKRFSSRAFAEWIEKKTVAGSRRLVFVIGGPYGFDDSLKSNTHQLVSLSEMTFSHQLVRLIFLEQLYRAMSIIKGEPYHHG